MLKKIDALRERAMRSPLAVLLFLAPCFEPPSLYGLSPVLDWIIAGWRIAAALCVAAFFLARPRVSAMTCALGAYYALTVLSSLVNHSDKSLYDQMNTIVNLAVMCLAIEMAAQTDPRTLVKALTWYLSALCAVNLLSIILLLCGVSDFLSFNSSYFMGYDNNHSFFFIPLLSLAMLYTWHSRRPVWVQLLLLALYAAGFYITWTASGVVAVSVFILLFALWRVKNSWKICNVGVYYGVIAVLFLLVVVLRVTNLFSFLFEQVLHKDLTLTGRVPIWEASFPYILDKPWLGNGQYLRETLTQMIGHINCHCMYLQIPFDTGVIGTAAYLAVLGLAVRPLMRTRKRFGGYILAAGLFSYLLMLEVESLVWPLPFYALLLLCFHAEELVPALEPAEN